MMFKKILSIALLFSTTTYGQGLTNRQLKASTIKNGSGVLTLPTSTDTLVGRATSDTLTNKTVDVFTYDDQASAPANPSAGFYKSYIKTDGKAYILNSAGTESKMGSGGGIFEASQNLILNNSFESDTSGWTASGSSVLARVTAAGNIIPPGIGAASWDPSAGSETLSFTSTTVTSNDGLSGRNGVLSCAIKTAATDMKMQAYDGSNVLTPNGATDVVPSSSTGFKRYSLNFIIPASGTIQARFLSASNSAIAYIDDCYFGLAEGFNISNVSQASLYGTAVTTEATNCSWTMTGTSYSSYSADTDCNAPTVTGNISAPSTKIPGATASNLPPGKYEVAFTFFGNLSANNCQYRITDGTTTSAEVYMGGSGKIMYASAVYEYTTAQSSVTWQLQGRNTTGGQTCTVELNASASVDNDLQIIVKRFPNSSNTLLSVDTSAASWSGYHDNTCSWARTNASFGDPTADASCALTQRTATNMSFAASGSVLPQITGYMDVADYEVCAYVAKFQGTASASGALQLLDGSSVVIAQQGFDADTTADETKNIPLCGIYRPTSNGTKVLNVQSRASSGSITISGNPVAIEWTVKKISQNFPAPLLVGSVNSNSTGSERIERAWIDNAGSCAINNQSGSWISSVSDPGVGQCTVNFAAGMFSSKPTCVVNSETISTSCTTQGEASTSSILIRCRATVAGTDADAGFSMMCMGPR